MKPRAEPPNPRRERTPRARSVCILRQWRGAAAAAADRYRDVKLDSTLLGWSDPDQVLRVAAGILGERASGGMTQALGSAARGAKPPRQCIEPGSLNPG